MRIDIPPAFFHFLGAMLILFGTLRAYHLGWKRREVGPGEPGSRTRPERRHVTFGILWVAMGLFLVVSTILRAR